ncbi:MAG TPA: alpha/beta hydrolase-fold protein [Chthoniobacterales bacterium]|nr:alpha/beta hydrolase-fold protein [Chthoniobacterales bacterium]
MPPHTLTGNIQQHRAFPSKILKNRRDVLVYLPPGYRRFSMRQYPVLYLQDGQNVFDAATSFAGVEWGVDETAQRLIRQKLMEPLIIVAIANTGEDRIHEYAPTPARLDPPKRKRSKGLLRSYGRFLVEELKPFIDRKYRTKREAEFTGLGGSSLGGLATITLGLWFPNYFNRLAVLSPSIWWDDCAIYDIVDEVDETKKPPLKIWLDTGTHEPGWERAAGLRDRLVEKGWRLHDDLHYLEVEGANHSEGAWAGRIDPVLRFLFPPPPPPVAKIAPIKKRRGLFQRALALANLFSA